MTTGKRESLGFAEVVGTQRLRLFPNRFKSTSSKSHEKYDRQVLLFGHHGQELLRNSRIAVVGLGGVGSIVSEYLSRLGVGNLVLIDPDRLEPSNFSRVIGARTKDLGKVTKRSFGLLRRTEHKATLKVDIAKRVALEANSEIRVTTIPEDFSRYDVARKVLDCDYIFLAADSMRARLVFNAIVQQYFIPGVQLGSKISSIPQNSTIEAAFSVVRKVTPAQGCLLCNQLIDSTRLAQEWKTPGERKDQDYGTTVSNPSVITMNAVTAAHAVNDFLFYFVGLSHSSERTLYRRFDHLTGRVINEEPRIDKLCSECSMAESSRYGMGDAMPLPCSE